MVDVVPICIKLPVLPKFGIASFKMLVSFHVAFQSYKFTVNQPNNLTLGQSFRSLTGICCHFWKFQRLNIKDVESTVTSDL